MRLPSLTSLGFCVTIDGAKVGHKKAPAIIVGALEYFSEGLEGFLEHLETILEGLKVHFLILSSVPSPPPLSIFLYYQKVFR